MRSALLLLAAAALLRPAAAAACSVCACGDPVVSASDPAAMAGHLRLQLDVEHLRVDAGADGAPGSTDRLSQWTTRLGVAWRPLDPLTVTAALPWVQREIRTVGGGPASTASDLSGVGDAELGLRWAAWRSVQLGARRVQELALSAGSSLPTGRKDARDAGGALIDPHGQVGTGAWGPYAGLHYRLEQGDWSGWAAASYRVRTEASYFDGTRYRFGDVIAWSVHGQWQAGRRWTLDLGLDARHARADRATDDAGAVEPRVPNTGGALVALAPAVYAKVVEDAWVFVRAQLPAVRSLRGEQDVGPTLAVGVQLLAY